MVNINDCCQNCGKDGSHLQRCKHCKVVFYCSDICRMEDSIEHNKVCTVKNVASANTDLEEQNIKFKKEMQIAIPEKDNEDDGNHRNNNEDKLSFSSYDTYDDYDNEHYIFDDYDDDDDDDEAAGSIDLEDIFNPFSFLNAFNPFINPFLLFNHPLICPHCNDFNHLRIPCPRCRKVFYCSLWCQLMHYPIHRRQCRPVGLRQCAQCESSNVELICSGCKKVAYCSRYCERLHWEHHKDSCVSSETRDKSFGKSSAKGQCARCKKSDAVLKKCSGCNNVEYCSKICQKTDWEQHKTLCNTSKTKHDKNSSEKSVKSQCARCKKSDVALRKCVACNNVEYCSKACQTADWEHHKTSCKTAKTADSGSSSKTSVKGQCARCKKSDAVLKKCSGCNMVEYCSKICQTADWEQHKTLCKELVKGQCARCKKSDVALRKCVACNKVEYCSKVCQTADWKHHKTSCKTAKTADSGSSSKTSVKGQCARCKKSNVALKKCVTCNNVEYCSKVCQTADWKHHKASCKTAKTADGESSSKTSVKGQCARCKKSDVALKKCVACNKVEYCSKVCQTADWEHHKTSCKTAKTADGESSSKTSVKGQCGKCKRSNVKLTKCTGCSNIEYCSKVCEIADWPDHRKSCQIPESTGQCANCTRSMRKCSGCQSVEYCSEECQSAHWKHHKTSCKASKTEADDHSPGKTPTSPEKSVESQCAKCKKSDVALKKCAACNNVEYCSKVCQTADWKHHKISCKTAKSKDDKSSSKKSVKAEKCDNCGKIEHLIKCDKCKTAKYCSIFCQNSAWPLHNKSCKSPNKDEDLTGEDHFVKTIHHAKWLFPSYKIILSFNEFVKEDQQANQNGNILLPVFILSSLGNPEEPAYIIADIDGYVKHLLFVLDDLDPYPYFSWEQLKPTRCVCILDPIISQEYKLFIITSAEQIRVL